jgi:hypothetical protein
VTSCEYRRLAEPYAVNTITGASQRAGGTCRLAVPAAERPVSYVRVSAALTSGSTGSRGNDNGECKARRFARPPGTPADHHLRGGRTDDAQTRGTLRCRHAAAVFVAVVTIGHLLRAETLNIII